jgi:hypothetical protein
MAGFNKKMYYFLYKSLGLDLDPDSDLKKLPGSGFTEYGVKINHLISL